MLDHPITILTAFQPHTAEAYIRSPRRPPPPDQWLASWLVLDRVFSTICPFCRIATHRGVGGVWVEYADVLSDALFYAHPQCVAWADAVRQGRDRRVRHLLRGLPSPLAASYD